MTRLAAATGLVAVLLLLAHSCHHQPAPTTPAVQPSIAANISPPQTARRFLMAILAGDLDTAETVSSPLLAQHLTSEPISSAVTTAAPSAIELTPLSQDAHNADVAVELRWADGNLAALRLRLVLVEDRWLVAEVGS